MVLIVEIKNLMRSLPDTPDAPTPQPISDWDRAVFERYWDYDFHQTGYAHPSQTLVGEDLGRSQSSVSRSIKRLIAAGHMRLHEKRWGRYRNGRRWLFHVYELLTPGRPRFDGAAARIVARARRRQFWTTAKRISDAVHTNHVVVFEKVGFSGVLRQRRPDVLVR